MMWGAICVFSLICSFAEVFGQNVTAVLQDAAPVNTNFSIFNHLLSITNVSAEINMRSSLTVLVPDNSMLDTFVSANLEKMHLPSVGDFCRYHVLLQYLDIQEIMQMTNDSGLLITTLYQATGRAEGIDGFVNMTFGNDIQFGLPPPNSAGPMTTVLNNFVRYPYNMSFMMISRPMMPNKLGMTAHNDHYPSVTNTLIRANIYSVFVKLLQDTGVAAAIQDREHEAFTDGVTVFAPSDTAFSGLPSGSLAALTDAQKLHLVQYHVLQSFFTFGTLKTQSAPFVTLASGLSNNKFLLNVTNNGPSGGLQISSGVAIGNVIATLIEDDPVGTYAIDAVLLPPEIFPLSNSSAVSPSPGPAALPPTAPAPSASPSPAKKSPPSPPPASPPPASPPPSPPSPPVSSSSSSSSASAPSVKDFPSQTADGPAEGPNASNALSISSDAVISSAAVLVLGLLYFL